MYRCSPAVFCVVSMATFSNWTFAEDWPGWRGPNGSGITTEKNLPVRWSAKENVRWKVPLHGAGVSTPVVWGERIYLTASDGRLNDQLHVYCYDRADGREVWHTRLFGSAQPEGQFAPGGMAVPTPATDGQLVWALFGTGDLVCLDADGRPVWMRSLAEEYGPFRNRWGMAASPILADGRLLVQVDHWGQSYLLAVDAKTGTNRWRAIREVSVNWTSPVVATVGGKKQAIVAGTHKVQAYDLDSGKELWTVRGMQEQCIPTPVLNGDILYAVSGPRGNTLAIHLDGKTGDLTDSNVVWKKVRGAPNIPSAVCYEGYYYMVDDRGLATCLSADSGSEIWQERLGGEHRASIVAGDGKLYFTSMDGTVNVLKAGATFEVLSKNKLGESVVATPAFSRGQIFLRGEQHLFCIEEKK